MLILENLYQNKLNENFKVYSPADLVDLDLARIPYHVAVIMDGNRRWAKSRGFPSTFGHWKGADALTKVVKAACELGIKVLTVYSFSTENWKRPKEEVRGLMRLFGIYLSRQRASMLKEGVRFCTIGDLSKLPENVVREIELSKASTAHCNKMDLVIAINYGGRDDIRRAIIAMLEDCEKGKLSREEISEKVISQYLDTSPWPDPDMLIRSSGNKRQSNFLLWQLSYSEFYHTDVLWPDMDKKDLLKAVLEFQRRESRLGG